MNLINNLGKNEEKYLVLLYSDNYNYENEGNCDFVVNPNFFYLTKCCIPNCIFIFENNNLNIFLGEEYFKRDIKKIKYIKNLLKKNI